VALWCYLTGMNVMGCEDSAEKTARNSAIACKATGTGLKAAGPWPGS
jgi:hypothetical protein